MSCTNVLYRNNIILPSRLSPHDLISCLINYDLPRVDDLVPSWSPDDLPGADDLVPSPVLVQHKRVVPVAVAPHRRRVAVVKVAEELHRHDAGFRRL